MVELNKNQSISLESMRGLSAIFVVIAHAYQFFIARHNDSFYHLFALLAQSSVMIFFVMSGFLIGKSIQSNYLKNDSFKLNLFAESRFKRIYPPLVASILLVVILGSIAPYVFQSGTITFFHPDGWIKGKSLFMSDRHALGALTFMNGILPTSTQFNTPLWSLPFEVWYYVVAGLLFTKRLFLIAFAIMIFYFISMNKPEFFLYSFVWFFGLTTAYASTSKKYASYSYIFIFIMSSYMAVMKGITFYTTSKDIELFNLFFGISFCSALYIFILKHDFNIKIAPSSAKYSYTLYVTHFPIMMFVIGCFERQILNDTFIASVLSISSVFVCIISANILSKVVENKRVINRFS